jgi:DNA polymerase-3 subunit delta'
VDRVRTLGQPAAVAAIGAMLRSGLPHAILLVGPEGVGKTTLALDVAASLLCAGDGAPGRPCRSCRGCRMVEHGNHPDLHRLAPVGPGGWIPIGGRDERGVRDLVAELALMPVEGGARVAVIEDAHRMTEDAQSALLKTLEEPPSGTTLILCADAEDRLLPTIRSRCARVRLGSMGPRDVEAILAAAGVADAPTAARLARVTEGRPGPAIAFARAPEAAILRDQIAREIIDLLGADLTARLARTRDLAARSAEMLRALDAGAVRAASDGNETRRARGPGVPGARGRRGSAAAPAVDAAGLQGPAGEDGTGDGELDVGIDARPTRIPAAERRRSALAVLEIWRSVVRDLALAMTGNLAAIRQVDLVDDLRPAAARVDQRFVGSVLRRLDLAAEHLDGNVSPELVLDVLALRWTPLPVR